MVYESYSLYIQVHDSYDPYSRETMVYESYSLCELHTLEGLRRIYKSTTRTTRTTRTSRETMVYESYSLWELHIIRGT